MFYGVIRLDAQTEPFGMDHNADVIDHTSFDSLWQESTVRGKLLTTAWGSHAYRAYRESLAGAMPEAYFPRARTALWVNAYLACLIEVMHLRTGYRSTSWDSLWLRRDTFMIAGRRVTLEDMTAEACFVAHTVGVVACMPTGSTRGAPLPPRAATARTMRILMRDQLRRICRSERYLLFDLSGNVLQLSTFFRSMQDSMKAEAKSIPNWVLPYVTDAVAAQLALGASTVTVIINDGIETWRKARPP